MTLRWAILIALWTMLSGPVFNTQTGQSPAATGNSARVVGAFCQAMADTPREAVRH